MNSDPESKPQGSEQPIQEEFDKLMNWCADMEMHTNPKLTLWTDEWIKMNFGEGVLNDDVLEISAGNLRKLVCVSFAKGKFSDKPLPNPSADEEVETPRTEIIADADLPKHPNGDYDYELALSEWADFARQLERELIQLRQQHNAEREKFEYCEECNFPLSACGEKNVDGTPSTDCKVCQLRASLAELQGWKESAMAVMPDYQEIGRLLGLPLGVSVHDKIIPGIKTLQSELATAQKDRDEARKLQDVYYENWQNKLAEYRSLTRQLQSAMEERDAWKQRADLLNEHNEKWVAKIREQEDELSTANSRLEEAEKALREITETNWTVNQRLTPFQFEQKLHRIAARALSRLSTSRSTEKP